MDNKFTRFWPHLWECAVNTKERHSSWLDWLPMLGCVGVLASPLVVWLLPSEVTTYNSWLQYISDHSVIISLWGLSAFLFLMLCHSFSLYDDLAERISYKRIDGMWIRLNDRHSGIYKLTGKSLVGEFSAGQWDNNVSGHYDPRQRKFIIKTIRQRPNGSDRAVLLGTAEVLNEDTIRIHIYSSDGGHQDVPVGWTEIGYLERVKGPLPMLPSLVLNAPASKP
jgi:hypothetical protein